MGGTIEFILGIIFFPLIFCAVTNFLKNSVPGKKFCKRFEIKTNGILDIGNKLTSSTFAFLACLTGITVAKQCNAGNELTERFYVLDNYLIFGFSYFFYDIVSMFMVFSTEHKEEVTVSTKEAMRFLVAKPMIILHHVFVPLVGFPLLMLFSFFLCRVMLFPYLYYWYACVMDKSILSALLSISPWVHLAVLGLWSPQLIWFHRMLKGSLKLIKEAKKGKRVVEETNQPEEEKEAEESEKQEENLIPEDLNKGESEEEESLLQKKVD